ncbi:MAG: class I mannose-6-phosphate isomerase [Armatimonadetes bacterium]|nr:class I mannose-6-phosphate isomerase [Armatimonadota bacterium]
MRERASEIAAGGSLRLYPLKFHEVYQERVWGGDGLARVLGKELPAGAPIGESWEVADHPHATSVVRNGPYAGMRLDALREQFGAELIGERALALGRGRLPLLIKFLDCRDRLSVQVHPDDAYAAAHEGGSLGKTELWYVVAAEPGARIWCGLKPGIDRPALEQAIAAGRVPETLAEVEAAAGDCLFIPAGRVHALGEGLIICEIQQNSDVTYRFYDWDRVGLDGKPRQLHITQSLEVIDYGASETPYCQPQVSQMPGAVVARLATCPQFAVEKLTVTGQLASDTGGSSFHTLSAIIGEGYVRVGDRDPEPIRHGETVLIPCAAGAYTIESAGNLELLRAFIP